jgi:hypothetical protein
MIVPVAAIKIVSRRSDPGKQLFELYSGFPFLCATTLFFKLVNSGVSKVYVSFHLSLRLRVFSFNSKAGVHIGLYLCCVAFDNTV